MTGFYIKTIFSLNDDGTDIGNYTPTQPSGITAIITEKAACHGGTATCRDRAVCKYCGEPYGGLDPKNHTNLAY